MQTFAVRHVTAYRYRNPVAFGEHRMMFRPREDIHLKVIAFEVDIRPAPTTLRVLHDAFGNHVEIARFSGLFSELRFESTFVVDHAARGFTGDEISDHASRYPFAYVEDETPDLACFIERQEADPGNEVGVWARRFLPSQGSIGTLDLLESINAGVRDEFAYRRRDTKGIQPALETLRVRHGSCRDFAMLMIEACRSLGFAARFASGYLAVPLEYPDERCDGSARGATHAWAQIYLPGEGWINFDPTSRKIGGSELITVAVVRNPRHAIPLHGTFLGAASDALGMEVEVDVRRESGSLSRPTVVPRDGASKADTG
jgi:transglutaminase-like putative cysteine protease